MEERKIKISLSFNFRLVPVGLEPTKIEIYLGYFYHVTYSLRNHNGGEGGTRTLRDRRARAVRLPRAIPVVLPRGIELRTFPVSRGRSATELGKRSEGRRMLALL